MILSSCSSYEKITKGEKYAKMYEEAPVSLLVMPPINNTTNVEAKELCYATVAYHLAEAGYYVLPSNITLEILREESAYDAENYIDAPLGKFKEYFGADAAVFPVIDRWIINSKYLNAQTDIKYIVKSTTTNEILFERRCRVFADTRALNIDVPSFLEFIDNLVAGEGMVEPDCIEAIRITNAYVFEEMPYGKLSPNYLKDKDDKAKKSVVNVSIGK